MAITVISVMVLAGHTLDGLTEEGLMKRLFTEE